VRSIYSLLWLPLPTLDLFCRFVYQVVVSKTLAPKELVKVFESDERVVLPPWDPMVS
jgi:aminopeptidase C